MSYPPPGAPQPYGYPSPPPSGPVRLRGRVPRLLGWIFLVVGIALVVIGGVIVATKSLGKVNDFQRVTLSNGIANGTVNIDGTGKWVVYYEASDVSDSTDRLVLADVAVQAPGGQPVQAPHYGNRSDQKIDKFTYDYNGHKGIAAFQFTATETGTYQIRAEAVPGVPAGADIAIGRDIRGGAIAGGVLVIIGVLALVAAIVLLIVGFVKRGRHRRELQAGAYYPAPPPYGPPSGPPPGPEQTYYSPPPPYPGSPPTG